MSDRSSNDSAIVRVILPFQRSCASRPAKVLSSAAASTDPYTPKDYKYPLWEYPCQSNRVFLIVRLKEIKRGREKADMPAEKGAPRLT